MAEGLTGCKTGKNGDHRKLQEFNPLSTLLQLLPHKAQKGLFTTNVQLMCIDADATYIALGTNIGLVFLYDRQKATLQRLNCQVKTETITCVRIQLGLDHLVAAGTTTGAVRIFQLPSPLPGRAKQLAVFRVDDLHCVPVTCLEWSVNGMKLYSGDRDGKVIVTDIDYSQHTCKSMPLLQEIHDIVQLSYNHKTLVVSTHHRTIVCHTGDHNRIQQIGTKERKGFGPYGAIFSSVMCRIEDSIIYAARPGFRIWKANIEGAVQATYMFKDLVHTDTCPNIIIWPDIERQNSTQPKDGNFGPLHLFNSNQILTWNKDALYVLDIDEGVFTGCRGNIGEIVDVATTGDEIFVIRRGEDDRRVIRISFSPDPEHLPDKAVHQQDAVMTIQLDNTPRASPRVSPHGSPKISPRHPHNFSPGNLFGNLKSKGLKETLPHATESMKSLLSKTKLGVMKMEGTVKTLLGENPTTGESNKVKAEINAAKEANVVVDSADGIISPEGPLPPVIKLASDDLLQIEIQQPAEVKEDDNPDAFNHSGQAKKDSNPPDLIPNENIPVSSESDHSLSSSPGKPTKRDAIAAIPVSKPDTTDDIVFKHVKVKKKKVPTATLR